MSRVLLVGWDGATWDALDPLLAAGRLPHLAELIGRGWRTTLESTGVPRGSRRLGICSLTPC